MYVFLLPGPLTTRERRTPLFAAGQPADNRFFFVLFFLCLAPPFFLFSGLAPASVLAGTFLQTLQRRRKAWGHSHRQSQTHPLSPAQADRSCTDSTWHGSKGSLYCSAGRPKTLPQEVFQACGGLLAPPFALLRDALGGGPALEIVIKRSRATFSFEPPATCPAATLRKRIGRAWRKTKCLAHMSARRGDHLSFPKQYRFLLRTLPFLSRFGRLQLSSSLLSCSLQLVASTATAF